MVVVTTLVGPGLVVISPIGIEIVTVKFSALSKSSSFHILRSKSKLTLPSPPMGSVTVALIPLEPAVAPVPMMVSRRAEVRVSRAPVVGTPSISSATA